LKISFALAFTLYFLQSLSGSFLITSANLASKRFIFAPFSTVGSSEISSSSINISSTFLSGKLSIFGFGFAGTCSQFLLFFYKKQTYNQINHNFRILNIFFKELPWTS